MISIERVDPEQEPNLDHYKYKVTDEFGDVIYCYTYQSAAELIETIDAEFQERMFMQGGFDARDGRGRELNQGPSYDRGYWSATEMKEILEELRA